MLAMKYVSTNDIENCINPVYKNPPVKNPPVKNKYKKKEEVKKNFVKLFTGIKLNIKINDSDKQFKKVKYIFEHFINDIHNIILRINENIKIVEKNIENLRINENIKIVEKNIENERRPNKLPTEKYLIDINIKVKKRLYNFKKYLINLKFRILVSKLLFLRVYKTYGRPKSNSVVDYHKIKLREYIAKECNNKCQICGYELKNDCTYEHIIPVSEGGATSYENGTVVHSSCNQYLGILSQERKRRMLIDPDDVHTDDFDYDFDFDFDFDDY